jgi:hypothetical protein
MLRLQLPLAAGLYAASVGHVALIAEDSMVSLPVQGRKFSLQLSVEREKFAVPPGRGPFRPRY